MDKYDWAIVFTALIGISLILGIVIWKGPFNEGCGLDRRMGSDGECKSEPKRVQADQAEFLTYQKMLNGALDRTDAICLQLERISEKGRAFSEREAFCYIKYVDDLVVKTTYIDGEKLIDYSNVTGINWDISVEMDTNEIILPKAHTPPKWFMTFIDNGEFNHEFIDFDFDGKIDAVKWFTTNEEKPEN